MMRTIDPEHNWFYKEGYRDGLDDERAIAPIEARHPHQRSDYLAGYEAGREERAARAETETEDRDMVAPVTAEMIEAFKQAFSHAGCDIGAGSEDEFEPAIKAGYRAMRALEPSQ
jgi:hypothetical protein